MAIAQTACSDGAKPRWDPQDYARHSATQRVWAAELLARLGLRGDERILDVGCGDGGVTAQLAQAVPRGKVVGVDHSAAMIAAARTEHRGTNLEFQEADARRLAFAAANFDVVFSNAALHWVDDHRAFLRGAARALVLGGRLAVSCGGRGNAQEVFHSVRTVLRREAWRGFFRRMERPYFFFAPEQYERWLPEAGFRAERVRLAAKDALHADTDAFAGWFRTTWLPYTQRVPEPRRAEFVAQVVAHYLGEHPPDAAGRIRVRMVRLEIEATRV